MSAQAAGKAAVAGIKAAGSNASNNVLNKGAKRDPELYVSVYLPISPPALLERKMEFRVCLLTSIGSQVLFGIMSGVFGLAGYYFGA